MDDNTNSTYNIDNFSLTGDKLKQFQGKYENLVFEGGGIRGIAFGGVIKFFEEHDLIKYVKRIAGSSAGSIVATAIALGYTGEEVIDILNKTDFGTFKDDGWVVVDIYRFFNEYGIYKGDKLLEWVQKLVKDKTQDENFTFNQLYDKYGIELVITGTCLNKGITYYFHHQKWPDMPLALAVRISASIPLVFKAVRLHTKEPEYDDDGNQKLDKDGKPIFIEREDIMVDGGLLNNYPIWVFDGKTIGDDDVDIASMEKSKTLGFKLMSGDEKQDSRLYYYYEKIDGITAFLKAFIDSMTIQIERGHIKSGYWDKTVCINTNNIHTLDFKISKEQEDKLIQAAYDATKNHFYCQHKNIPNKWNCRET